MAIPLSDRTREVLNACFVDPEQREEIAGRLEREVGDEHRMQAERVQFSVIRLIVKHPESDYPEVAFRLLKEDWRDLFMAAGHGSMGDAEAWAQQVLREPPRVLLVAQTPMPVTVDAKGWARCPKCNFRFKLSNPSSFDGQRHLSCRQPLLVRPPE